MTRLTDTVALRLRAAGCAIGDRVAVAVSKGPLSVACFLAVESLGAVYVPLDRGWPAERCAAVLNSANCRAALADELATSSPDTGALRAARKAGVAVSVVSDRPDRTPGAPSAHAPSPGEARYILYTSGSSGRPKGVVVSQLGMINHVQGMVALLALTERDVVAFSAPPSHVISVWQLTSAIMVGGAVAVVDQEAVAFPRRLVGEVERAGITIMQLVPATLEALLTSLPATFPVSRLLSLRVLLSTGAPVRAELLSKAAALLPAAELRNAYGATECSDDVAHHVFSPGAGQDEWVLAGVPLPGVATYLLARHADGWDAVEPGQAGELFVGGAGVATGYVAYTPEPDQRFFRDPFDPASPTGLLYQTGDLATFDRGQIRCLGRKDRQVKILGVRIELDEIEVTAARMTGVNGAAAVLVDGRVWLFYQGETVTSAAIREHLLCLLPPGAVPSRMVRVSVIPRTISGKADYERLRLSARSGQR